ncbi:MAG: isochorismate synthase, partial [Polyangiaceae bacterium]
GSGAALRVDVSGRDRWAELRTATDDVFASLDERRETGVVAPRVRLFGGASFHPSVEDILWQPFGSASFVLPRWSYGVKGNDAFLRFALRVDQEVDRAAVLTEIEAVTASLERTPERLSRTSQAVASSTPPADETELTGLIERALAAIAKGELDKVVVARRASIATAVSVDATFAKLRAKNPESTAFSFTRGGSTFLGASPERLVFSNGTRIVTEALAGTIARREDDDEAAKAELFASDKERREHQIVVGGITRALAAFTRGIDAPSKPNVRTLGRVHHLSTPIVAQLQGSVHVLLLVEALHPTPALAGLPKTAAFDWIEEHEPFERGWYGAPVGWLDSSGEGAFAVAIRSALVTPNRAWLFAGGGIVRGSEPEAELRETSLKLRTMSEALVRA